MTASTKTSNNDNMQDVLLVDDSSSRRCGSNRVRLATAGVGATMLLAGTALVAHQFATGAPPSNATAADGSVAATAAASVVSRDSNFMCSPYTGPSVDKLKIVDGIFHEHSSYSDGDPYVSPEDYYTAGRDNGYGFMGSSEHSDFLDDGFILTVSFGCLDGPESFAECATPTNPEEQLEKWEAVEKFAKESTTDEFLGIRGFEWTSYVYGHINIYFSQNFANVGVTGEVAVFWDWFMRDPEDMGAVGGSPTGPTATGGGNDGIAHFNHPGYLGCQDLGDPQCDWNDWEFIPEAAERMFGVEAYNGPADDRYIRGITRGLDKGWHLSFVGSEDEHGQGFALPDKAKTSVLLVDGKPSEDNMKEAMLARRTYAVGPGQELDITTTLDQQHPMGSAPACKPSTPLQYDIEVIDRPTGKPFAGIAQLYTNGGEVIVERALVKGRASFPEVESPASGEGERWYFVHVLDTEGNAAAMVAPVFISAE